MKFTRTTLLGLSIILMMTAAPPLVSAQAAHVRWDIMSVTSGPGLTPPFVFNPGGSATAVASDGSTITLTGSGTFVSSAHGGSTSAVKGGGTWKVTSAGGTVTGSGTYEVTEVVSWLQTTTEDVPGVIDNVGNIAESSGGLAVLRVAYSDGTTGVLTVSCNGAFDPFSVFEGVIASKGAVQYWNPGIYLYFTLFHVN